MEPQLADLIAKGDVSFEYRHFVVGGARSQWGAEAVECAADQGKFWAYHDLLLLKAQAKADYTLANLKTWGNEVGLEAKQFVQCIDSHKYEAKVKQQSAEAVKLGLDGTPSFFLNGKPIRLMQDPKNPDNPFVQIVEMVKQAVNQK